MKNRTYASRLTKEDLIRGGITLITKEGLVFKGEEQVSFSVTEGGYLNFWFYELDEEGNKIKKPIVRTFNGCKNPVETYVYEARTVGLHRAIWAWIHGEVPEGYVVDHINNKHENIEDYHISNLQLLTPAQNLLKERGTSTKQLKCNLNKPLSHYENKLLSYAQEYEEAKKNHEADKVHKLRTNIANTKAKIRYYIAHQEEADRILAANLEEQARIEARQARIEKAKELEEYKLIQRAKYLDAKIEYGADHFITLNYKADWHDAVKDLNDFLNFTE